MSLTRFDMKVVNTFNKTAYGYYIMEEVSSGGAWVRYCDVKAMIGGLKKSKVEGEDREGV